MRGALNPEVQCTGHVGLAGLASPSYVKSRSTWSLGRRCLLRLTSALQCCAAARCSIRAAIVGTASVMRSLNAVGANVNRADHALTCLPLTRVPPHPTRHTFMHRSLDNM